MSDNSVENSIAFINQNKVVEPPPLATKYPFNVIEENPKDSSDEEDISRDNFLAFNLSTSNKSSA